MGTYLVITNLPDRDSAAKLAQALVEQRLAAIVVAALQSEQARGVYNACDDGSMKLGDFFDLVADRAGLARPPRVSRLQAALEVPPELFSFMKESRRLSNRRMKTELGVRLRYATPPLPRVSPSACRRSEPWGLTS